MTVRIMTAPAVTAMLWLAAIGAAQAVMFEGTARGRWVNPDASFGFTIDNNDIGGNATVEWGTPLSGSFSNRFVFDGIGSDGGSWSTPAETPFKVGDFSYRNGTVGGASHDLEGIELAIDLLLSSPLSLPEIFTFDFDVTSTPNTTGDPVLDGDIVTVSAAGAPTVFTHAGTDFTLDLLGFSSDGGATIRTDFSSPEGATADAELFARMTSEITAVPEPGSLGLALLAAAGAGLAHRRRRA